MPCSCQIPVENFPDAVDWGPILWALLHGLAERAGKVPFPLFQQDERLIWLRIFPALGEIIPCETCKAHYKEQLKQNPVDSLKTISQNEVGPFLRTWFWDLHEDVNGRLGKPSFPFDQLAPTQGSSLLRRTLAQLSAPIQKVIKIRGQQLLAWMQFQKHLGMLFSFYSV